MLLCLTGACTTTVYRQNDLAATGFADNLDAPIPVDQQFTRGRLANGLSYYIRQNREPRNRAVFMLVLQAGSILEDEDQRGLAHFLEHMAFNGTRHFPDNSLVEYLESIGMAFGPGVNAMTGFDATTYYLTIPTDNTAYIDQAFLILEDWAGGLTLADAAIDAERGVVLEEWRLRRGAAARLRDQYLPVLLHNSLYAQRLPIGSREILENFDPAALRRFYSDWYRPELMAVIAVGDLDPNVVERQIQQHFSRLENPPSPRLRKDFPVPDHNDSLFIAITDPELTQTQVSLYFKHDPLPEKKVGDFRDHLVRNLYNSLLNNRFNELQQQSDPPFQGASSWDSSLTRSKDGYSLSFTAQKDGITKGLEALFTETLRVHRFGFTKPELERQQKNMLSSMERRYQEKDKSPSMLFAREFSRSFLWDEPIPGISNEYRLITELLPTIHLEEINHLADRLMTRENRVTIITTPEQERSSLPDATAVNRLLAAIADRDIAPYEEKILPPELIAEDIIPGKITGEKYLASLGVTVLTMGNGVQVILKPTDFQNDQILFTAFSPGGHSLVPDREFIAATTAASVVMNNGFGQFSPVDLNKKLAGKTVSVSPYISELTEGISGNAASQDMETMLQLIYLAFTAPRTDAEAFASLLSRTREALRLRDANPAILFADTVNEILSRNHYRRQPMTLERIAEMDLETSMKIYRDRFADAGDFTFVFVGSFSIDRIKPLLASYLATLPATGRQESFRDINLHSPSGRISRYLHKGLEPKAMATIIFPGQFHWSQQSRYDILSLVQLLNIRLRDAIREDKGGTYNIRAAVQMRKYPKQQYELAIQLGCAPDRYTELSEAILALINDLQEHPPTGEEIETLQELQRRNREIGMHTNGYWLNILEHYAYHHEDLTLILNYDALIDNLTPAAITRAARTCLNPDNSIQVVLLPAEEAKIID